MNYNLKHWAFLAAIFMWTHLSAQGDGDNFGASNVSAIMSFGGGITNPFGANTLGGTGKCNFFLDDKFNLGVQLFFTENASENTAAKTFSPGHCIVASAVGSYYLLGDNAGSKWGIYGLVGLGYANVTYNYSFISPRGSSSNQWEYGYNANYRDEYFQGNAGLGVDYKLLHGRFFAELVGMTALVGTDTYTQNNVSGAAIPFTNKYSIGPGDFGKYGALLFSIGYTYCY